MRVDVGPDDDATRTRPSPVVIGGVVAAVVLALALVGGLLATDGGGGDSGGGDGGGEQSGGDGGEISTSAALEPPTEVAVELDGTCPADDGDDTCDATVSFTDQAEGEDQHALVKVVGRKSPEEGLGPPGTDTGESLTMTTTVAVDSPTCLSLEARAGAAASDATEPVCVLATTDGRLLAADQFVAAWDLQMGECVKPLPGRPWDGEGASSYFERSACDFLSGAVYARESPHMGGQDATCRAQAAAAVSFSAVLTEDDAGTDVLVCISHG